MRNRIAIYFYSIFAAIFVISFGYFFLQQHLTPAQNTNTPGTVIPGNTTIPNEPSGGTALAKFNSYDQFKKFLADNMTTAGYGSGPVMRNMMGEAAPGVALDLPKEFAGFSGQSVSQGTDTSQAPDYSQTNVQIAGVDEADIIKSDGTYLYIVSRNHVHIVAATPAADAKILSTLNFDDYPQEIYISDDHTRLAVYGSQNQIYPMGANIKMMPIRNSGQTFFKVYDITDKTQPKEIRKLSFEGYATDSRMVGNYVYFITSKNQYDWYNGPFPLPRIMDNDKLVGGEPDAAGYRFPDVYYFPFPYQSSNLTTVSSINIMDPSVELSTQNYVLENGQQLFVSPDNIYITYTKNLDSQEIEYDVMKSVFTDKLTAEERAHVQEIEAAPNYILTKYERQSKAQAIFQMHLMALNENDQKALETQFETAVKQKYAELADQFEVTNIYKIGFKDGVLTYRGNASVPGSVINQFAMDESNGYFRIATTKNPVWIPYGENDQNQKPYNNLYVLDPDMKRVGAVEHLAEGERIYSVRFMQGRAYMVTFQQVDPLFVIDLSDPAAPRVLGELKVPGYSSYLHPMDDTTLIGLGKETETNQFGSTVPKGVKISIFDVADVAHPVEKASYSFNTNSSDSPALYDHKAFLFSGSKNLLVIPLQVWSAGGSAPKGLSDNFMGAAVFTVTKDSIALKGFVKHASEVQNGYSYDQYVQRSLYIGDVLYTLSDAYLKASGLSDLSEIKSIAFPAEDIKPVPIPLDAGAAPGATSGSAPAAKPAQ